MSVKRVPGWAFSSAARKRLASLGPAWAAGAVSLAISALILHFRRDPCDGLGPANRVTLARAALVAVLAGALAAPEWVDAHPVAIAIVAAMALADLSTYVTTAMQLAVAFPDPVSGLAGAATKFLGIFALTQIPLALAEGLLGLLLFRVLNDIARPELTRLGVLRPAAPAAAGDATGATSEVAR